MSPTKQETEDKNPPKEHETAKAIRVMKQETVSFIESLFNNRENPETFRYMKEVKRLDGKEGKGHSIKLEWDFTVDVVMENWGETSEYTGEKNWLGFKKTKKVIHYKYKIVYDKTHFEIAEEEYRNLKNMLESIFIAYVSNHVMQNISKQKKLLVEGIKTT